MVLASVVSFLVDEARAGFLVGGIFFLPAGGWSLSCPSGGQGFVKECV